MRKTEMMNLKSMEILFPVLNESEQKSMVGGIMFNKESTVFHTNGSGASGGGALGSGSGFTRGESTVEWGAMSVANNGTPDGFCYFNCLGYLSDKYHCGKDNSYYMNQYGKTYGFEDVINGPTQSGFIYFTSQNFLSTSLLQGSEISWTLQNTSKSIMAAITISEGYGHAVILTNYHSQTRTYSYYDPTTKNYGIVTSSDVMYAIGVENCLL